MGNHEAAGVSSERRCSSCSSLNQCWNIANWTPRNKLQWNLNWNSYIFIQENAFQNVIRKMVAILSWSHCVTENLRKSGQWHSIIVSQLYGILSLVMINSMKRCNLSISIAISYITRCDASHNLTQNSPTSKVGGCWHNKEFEFELHYYFHSSYSQATPYGWDICVVCDTKHVCNQQRQWGQLSFTNHITCCTECILPWTPNLKL